MIEVAITPAEEKRMEKLEKLQEFVQDKWEVIACVFNPNTKRWKCLSAADVGFPGDEKHEILEAKGKKFCNKYELIEFRPGEGEVTWISIGSGSRERILATLLDEIESLVKTGRTIWREKVAPPSLFEIIEGFEKEYGGATPVSKVYERASSFGISKKATEEFLSSESKKGTLYFPRGGSIGRPPWDEQFGGVVSMTKGEDR